MEYSLGDTANYFTHGYFTNLNGTPVANFLTTEQCYTKEQTYTQTQTDTLWAALEARIAALENQTTEYFIFPAQYLILSSKEDKYVSGFKTNIPLADLRVTYGENKSTITIESGTSIMYHYVADSTNNATFAITRISTGEQLLAGYLCTSRNGAQETPASTWVSGVGFL